jgi:hypothetical protein
MGFFDLPAPLFDRLDSLVEVLPPAVRLMLWGSLGAIVSMALYRWLSPQERISRGKAELAEARQRLDAHEGEFAEAGPLVRGMLRAAVVQVGRVAGPAILASLPLLSLLAWMSTRYGHAWPPFGSTPAIQTVPPLPATWVAEGEAANPHILVAGNDRRVIADVPLQAPVPVIHKRQWWNALLGNPAGYLPAQGAVERIRIDLPERQYLHFGPGWVRGWELAFFVPLLLVSVAIKVLAGIE